MKLASGDTFKIKINKGFGVLQYFETMDDIEYIRVLASTTDDAEVTQRVIDQEEMWTIGFPVTVAARKKVIERIGNFEIPEGFKTPKYARTTHNIRGEHLGWHIVDRYSWQREFKAELNEGDLKLSPWGIWNETLLVERLNTNWSLSEWK